MAKSRYDILANELIYKFKNVDDNGQIVLKDAKWSPHNIKTLMICSQGCLVESYTGSGTPKRIDFKGYSDDEKSKPLSAVIYSLNKLSAHMTNLRDLIVVTGGDLPLNHAIDAARLQSLSSAFLGVYVLVKETPNSSGEDLMQLYKELQSAKKSAIDVLCERGQGYDFNMGLTDKVWSLCTGTRKPDGTPYELSFKDNQVTISGNKRSLGEMLNQALPYGYSLHLSGEIYKYKWARFGGKSVQLPQTFDTRCDAYPVDTALSEYVVKHYHSAYAIVDVLSVRKKNEAFALSKEDRKLTESCIALIKKCSEFQTASGYFQGAVHYLRGSDLAEGTQEVFTTNIAWLLSMVCSEQDKSLASTLNLPQVDNAVLNDRYKTFAVQSFARSVLITAMCIEAQILLGSAFGMGIPDNMYCSMRQALVYKSKSGAVPECLCTFIARDIQVVAGASSDVAQGIVSGSKNTLWRLESSTKVSDDMISQHMELIALAAQGKVG